MKTSKPAAGLLLLALGSGCYGHHGHGAWLGAVIGASIITAAVVSAHPPPPPHYAVTPPPRPGYSWQPGYWVREEGEWAWVDGHWIADYPGYQWEPARWIEDPDGNWRLLPGRWLPLTPPPPPPPPR